MHDLGKLLLLFGSEGQWDVVGVSLTCLTLSCISLTLKTFRTPLVFFFSFCLADKKPINPFLFYPVVGCKYSDKNIYPETFKSNPDYNDAVYSTECGIYKPHCGLDNVMLSWGHDEVRLFLKKIKPGGA